MDLKVLLVVLSFAAVALAVGPNVDVFKHQQQIRGQQINSQQFPTTYGSLKTPESILQKYCKSSQMPQETTTQLFKQLIEAVKQTPAGHLEQLTQQVTEERLCQGATGATKDEGAEELIKDVYMDALINAETRDSMKQVMRAIDSGKIDKVRANFYLTRLALADESSTKDDVAMELVESFIKSSPSSSSSSGMSREFTETIERQKMFAATAAIGKQLKSIIDGGKTTSSNTKRVQYERLAEQLCRTIGERYINSAPSTTRARQEQEPEKQAELNAALKAIANIPSSYYPKEMKQLLAKLAEQREEAASVRQSAIEALEECDEVRELVKRLAKDQQEPIEVRIAAYRALMTMQQSTEGADIDEIVQLVRDERRQQQDKQFVMYVVSHLNNVRNTNNHDQAQIRDKLHANKQNYMAIQLLAKKYNNVHDMRKHSRNYQLEQTIAKIDSGIIVDADLIYDDETTTKSFTTSTTTGTKSQKQQQQQEYLPKLMRLNVTMPVAGTNVNVMEISIRQDNMEEQVMRAIRAPLSSKTAKDGKFDMDTIERIVDSIKTVAQNDKTTKDGETCEADVSVKVDGVTVLYVSLDDFKMTAAESKLAPRQRRSSNNRSAFEDVIDAMKRNFAFNRGAHFAINKRLAGVLDIDAVISGALRVESRAVRATANGDSFEIVAHVQPRFGLEAIVGPAATSKRLLQRVSTQSSLGLRLKYARSELVDVQIDLPMAEMELFKIQSEIVEKTADGSYKYIGRDNNEDVYSSSSLTTSTTYKSGSNKMFRIGKNSNKQQSAYTKSFEMPAKFVRATGLDGKLELVYSPRQFAYLARCVVQKVEPSMQGYRVQIQSQKSQQVNKQQQYSIVISTPGASQIDRTIQMRVLKQQQPQSGRVTLKVDLISAFAAGSAQLELVRDERQVALRIETISRQGKAAKCELGFQHTSPVVGGKKQITLKPYMVLSMPNSSTPIRFEGLVSVQSQGTKSVVAYEFKMPAELKFGAKSIGSKQVSDNFVRGKIIADVTEQQQQQQRYTRVQGKRSMQSPIEQLLNAQDVTVSSETVAQLGQLAVKLHAMLESKAQESIGCEFNTQYQLGANKRQEQSKFAAKLHYAAPRGQKSMKDQEAQRQALYVEHSCTAHPEHAFAVQLSHAYKPYEQQDVSFNLHYSADKYNTKRHQQQQQQQQQQQETLSYSHSIKYNSQQQQQLECEFAVKATPFDFEREAKLSVQSDSLSTGVKGRLSSAKFANSQQRSSMQQQGGNKQQQQQAKIQFVLVDKINKETDVDCRVEMEQQSNDSANVVATLKLNNNKSQYRVAHQIRRQSENTNDTKYVNKCVVDMNGEQKTFDYVVRVDKVSRDQHEITVTGELSQQKGRTCRVESKSRLSRHLDVEHKTVACDGQYQLELVSSPKNGEYKYVQQTPEQSMSMMARVGRQQRIKSVQFDIKQRQQQLAHSSKLSYDSAESKLIVQSQQQSQQWPEYKLDSLIHLSMNQMANKESYVRATWNREQERVIVEYQPQQERLVAVINCGRVAHKTQMDFAGRRQVSLVSRTDKNAKLVCDIQAQMSAERAHLECTIPKFYDITMEMSPRKQQLRCSAKKGQENKKNKGFSGKYEQINVMLDASAYPSAKFETDATDNQGRRLSFAADVDARQGKPTTFAMQSPRYAGQSELVFTSQSGLSLKGLVKDLNRNERYELDTNVSTSGQRSHFKLDTPEHNSLAVFEPQTQSGELSYQSSVQNKYTSPFSFKTKWDSQYEQDAKSIKSKLGRWSRRAQVQYDDQDEKQEHSFELSPMSNNVKFMSERRYKQQARQNNNSNWWKLAANVSPFAKTNDGKYYDDEDMKESTLSWQSADNDADFNIKPFGDDMHAAWKIRSRRSINEGEIAAYSKKHNNNNKRYNKDQQEDDSKTGHKIGSYKAWMKHLSDKQLRALIEAECSSDPSERCKAKFHAPGKFTTRFEHDSDIEQEQQKDSRKGKFDFEFGAPARKFQHMSSFDWESPREMKSMWRNKRSIVSSSSSNSERRYESLRQQLENMDARIKSKTLWNDEELYNLEGQLYNNYNNNNNKSNNKQQQPSYFKLNAGQYRSDMQYAPESHAQFEFVTPEQRRHSTRVEPIGIDGMKFTTKSYNKQGHEQYKLQGQFPSSYLFGGESFDRLFNTKSKNTNNKNVEFDESPVRSIFDFQGQEYKAGFDFGRNLNSLYMSNPKTGFEHQTQFNSQYFDESSRQSYDSKKPILTTVTKSARFGTIAKVEVNVNQADKSMSINIESALIKGQIIKETTGADQKMIKLRFESNTDNKMSEHEQRQLARQLVEYLLPTTNSRTAYKLIKRVEQIVEELVKKSFVYEATAVYDEREKTYKLQTRLDRQQQTLLEITAAKMRDETVGHLKTRHMNAEFAINHKSNAFQLRADGQKDGKPFTHETVIEPISHDQASITSRTTYRQVDLAKIVGRVAMNKRSFNDKVSQIEATLYNGYQLMAQANQGRQFKIVVQDAKRQLVHEHEYQYDEKRDVLQFQCRTTDNKYNTVLYKAQGSLVLDNEDDSQVSQIAIEIPTGDNKCQLKAQYVPKKELTVVVDGERMKHMTKLEMTTDSSSSSSSRKSWSDYYYNKMSIKQMKLRSQHKCDKMSYEVEAFVDTHEPMYKIKAQAFDNKQRPEFELLAVGQPQQKSMAKLTTRSSNIELVADHKADTVDVRVDVENKKYQHETQIQRIGDDEFTFRSLSQHKNQQLAKIAGRVNYNAANNKKRVVRQTETIAEIEANLLDNTYKVSAQCQQIQAGKMHKIYLNIDDNKRERKSQNEIVFDNENDRVEFESRLTEQSRRSAHQQQGRQQQGLIYNAQGRIQLDQDNQEPSTIKYESARSQLNAEYKSKDTLYVDIETPELEHKTKLNMSRDEQMGSRTPWKKALKQMQLRSQLDAPTRSSPFNKYAYNFGADFDVDRKPSMVSFKLY